MVPPLSRNTTVTVALPVTFVFGLKVRLPVEPLMTGWIENKFEWLLLKKNVSDCELSFAGPLLIGNAHPAIVCRPEFMATIGFTPLLNQGASFTARTVREKVL